MDARENRAELVAAALTILKAYTPPACPDRPPRLQGFARMVGPGARRADVDRPRRPRRDPGAAARERPEADDPDPGGDGVVEELSAPTATTVAEAVAKAEAERRVGTWEDNKLEPIDPDLLDAFMAVARRGAAINPDVLGNYLSSVADRVVALETGATVRFEKDGTRHGAARWTLTVLAGGGEVPY